jgi:hypothetical protein
MSKFKKVNVAGDGACYFHAVVGFLDMERLVKDKKTYYKKGLDKEASDLRKKVVTWLRNNLTFQYENGLTIQDDIEDEIRNNPKIQSVNDYLRDMSRPSAYAGQIEITATANILKRNIRVFVKKQGKYRNVGLGYEINKSKDKDITLFHNMGTSKGTGKHHFEILFPTSKAKVVTKSNYDTLKSMLKYKMKRTGRANNRTKRVKRSKQGKRNRMRRSKVNRKTMRRKTMRRNTRRKTMRRNTRRKTRYNLKQMGGRDISSLVKDDKFMEEVERTFPGGETPTENRFSEFLKDDAVIPVIEKHLGRSEVTGPERKQIMLKGYELSHLGAAGAPADLRRGAAATLSRAAAVPFSA